MSPRRLILLFFLLTPLFLRGQDLPRLREVLKKGLVEGLNEYVAQLANYEICTKYREMGIVPVSWIRNNEILPGYSERVLRIRDCSDNRSCSDIYLNLLTSDSLIFYYRGLCLNKEEIPGLSGKDKILFTSFRESFRRFYHADPALDNFFERDGCSFYMECGIAGVASPLVDTARSFVRKRKYHELARWMRSGNTDMQLAAIYAYDALQKDGAHIDQETLGLIRYVLSKKGTILLCEGCDEHYVELRSLRRLFHSIEQ